MYESSNDLISQLTRKNLIRTACQESANISIHKSVYHLVLQRCE